MQSEPLAPPDPSPVEAEPGLPPLGISHLLMFMTEISVALALRLSLADLARQNSKALLSIGDFAACVIMGSGGALFVWLLIRAYRKKSARLDESGAKFALLLTAEELAHWLIGWLVMISARPSFPSEILILLMGLSFVVILFVVSLFFWGLLGIGEFAWRIVIAASILGYLSPLVSLTFLVAAAAIAYSLYRDRQNARSRHWTHYFGVILWCFSLIQTFV